MTHRFLWTLICTLLTFAGTLSGNNSSGFRNEPRRQSGEAVAYPVSLIIQSPLDAAKLFEQVETALSQNSINELSSAFSKKVYLSLFTGEKGYFSAEQSYHIIRNFMRTHSPVTFTFTRSSSETTNPYAVGQFTYMKRGLRGTAQVYISLSAVDRKWKINQITIAER